MAIFVLNKCYGGFSVSDFVVEQMGLDDNYHYFDGDEWLVLADLINEYGSEKCSGSCAKLKVVEIPDNFTDYEVNDYDGIETLTYVIDGKIYHA